MCQWGVDSVRCHFEFARYEQDPLELSASLKRIHDIALCFSEIPVDEEEKTALFNMKLLAEELEGLAGKD